MIKLGTNCATDQLDSGGLTSAHQCTYPARHHCCSMTCTNLPCLTSIIASMQVLEKGQSYNEGSLWRDRADAQRSQTGREQACCTSLSDPHSFTIKEGWTPHETRAGISHRSPARRQGKSKRNRTQQGHQHATHSGDLRMGESSSDDDTRVCGWSGSHKLQQPQ